ncbi:hypothetical protein [Siphonobacter sp. SORGH_AS_0500]|uniref:hypothetical protein n=1 Tax=Siphonobacter sp. SORGH_AS_0500 TaxID=1864824 RepID=UPI0028576B65|nr:hypothetical protein [Siphonobacter sp. SORGH_AS_0500]MDR6194734.1 hypothetical protein [Siphonobacter sp. SORGH_AS_0500]
MYQVIEGQEGVTFPFQENPVTLSKHTSQEDLKRVYEHPLGPGFVQFSEEQEPVSADSATEPLTPTPEQVQEFQEAINEILTEPKKAKKGGQA